LIFVHHLQQITDVKNWNFELNNLWNELSTKLWTVFTTIPTLKTLKKLPRCVLYLPRCFHHLPFFQPLNHLRISQELNDAKQQMEVIKKYKHELSREFCEYLKSDAQKCVAEILCNFQKVKILEAYGESAPQFCLQIAIIIRRGYISPTQLVSVIISILTFTLASSNVYAQMPTKFCPIPHQDWRNHIYVFPAMFLSISARLLSLGLIIAYLREYTFLVIVLALLTESLLLIRYLKDDTGTSLMGMFTSLFAPTIVKNHYTHFLLKTCICTAVTYMLSISLLFALIDFEVTVPDIQYLPPIFHCFKTTDWIPTINQKSCLYNGTNIVQNCSTTLMTITNKQLSGYVTVCQPGEEVWHQLELVCIALLILLVISVASGFFLHWYLDPINRLKATLCIGKVWDPDLDYLKEAVSTLVVQRKFEQFEKLNKKFLDKHNQTLLSCATKEGLLQFVLVLTNECHARVIEAMPDQETVNQDQSRDIKMVIGAIKGLLFCLTNTAK
jgi:hypothetical protein